LRSYAARAKRPLLRDWGQTVKFETVLFAVAFLILGLISLPKDAKEDADQAQNATASEVTEIIAQN
jgi:hypothetical protein